MPRLAEVIDHEHLARCMDAREIDGIKVRIRTREIARVCEVSHSFIAHLRSGHRTRCSAETARTIARLLGRPHHELFRDVPDVETAVSA